MRPHISGELTLKELLGKETSPGVVMECLTQLGILNMIRRRDK